MQRRMTRRRRGFTLIEILVVVVIIAMLAGAIVLTFSGKPDEARVARAKADISALETALETFRLDMRRYPTTEEGLQALTKKPDSEDSNLWKNPYLKRLEKDPWGNPYVYLNPGEQNEDGIDLVSYGSDGKPGGTGMAADITNYEVEQEPETSN